MLDEHAPDPLAARLLDAGAGELAQELRLNGELPLPGGGSTSTSLCLTSRGLFLVLRRAKNGEVLDLLAAGRGLRYRSKLLGDRLEIDDWTLGIPWGHSEEAKAMIGRARLRRGFGVGQGPAGVEIPLGHPRAAETSELPDGEGAWAWVEPFVDVRTELEREWLRRWLDEDERVLAFRRSDELHHFDSPVFGPLDSPKLLVITERRQQLVAISAAGELWSQLLPPQPLVFETAAVGRSSVRSEGLRLRLRLGDEPLFAALASWPGAEGAGRLRLVARALWLRGGGGRDATRVAAILDQIAAEDPLARLARVLLVDPRGAALEGQLALPSADRIEALVQGELPDPILLSLRELVAGAEAGSGEALLVWWREWELGIELGEVLVEHLCELGPRGLELALPLHERLRALWQAKLHDDPEDAALIDFVLVEHLLALGRAEQALELLRGRRERLPNEELQDLLPPTPERGGQQIRVELYELAAAAHGKLGDGHLSALAELARLQPLVRARIDALLAGFEASEASEASEGAELRPGLRLRVQRVSELLEDEFGGVRGALEAAGDGESTSSELALAEHRVRALDAERLELQRHPAARVDGALGRLQGALAKVVVPDCSVLKSYCERANLARTPALARAMADATMILGLGGVEVFVSRGDKSVGMRAYEGDTSFLLIGGDHLDPSSDAFLAEGPLRFAIAAELAHLRYAHSRVTGNEVWAGTLDLGLTGLGMLIVVAPVLKGLKAPAKHLLDKVGAPAVDRWRKRLARRDPHSLANDNSRVIAAYRAMQLSADRAGLVACGDPRDAIRAMFAVHPAYLALWPLVASHGLRAAVTKSVQSEDERLRLEDLAVRVAALLSFYLSDDYAELRGRVTGTRGAEPV